MTLYMDPELGFRNRARDFKYKTIRNTHMETLRCRIAYSIYDERRRRIIIVECHRHDSVIQESPWVFKELITEIQRHGKSEQLSGL